jgi:hypothetical protein
LAEVLKNTADCDLTGRVQGLFAKVIHHGKGECGSRSIEVLNNGKEFKDFQFNKLNPFNQLFSGGMNIHAKSSRKEATLTIDAFDPATQLAKNNAITHVQFCFTLLLLSDYTFNRDKGSYVVVNPSIHCKVVTVNSGAISLSRASDKIDLKTKFAFKDKIPNSVGVIAMVGMEFFKEEGGGLYGMKAKNSMKILDVG